MLETALFTGRFFFEHGGRGATQRSITRCPVFVVSRSENSAQAYKSAAHHNQIENFGAMPTSGISSGTPASMGVKHQVQASLLLCPDYLAQRPDRVRSSFPDAGERNPVWKRARQRLSSLLGVAKIQAPSSEAERLARRPYHSSTTGLIDDIRPGRGEGLAVTRLSHFVIRSTVSRTLSPLSD